jgi:DNA-binding response OmpR family regulator
VYYIEIVTMDKKVLLINNTGAASLIPGLLAANGFEVDTVSDPETGWSLLCNHGYHLAVILENPIAESWHLCEKIRRLSDIPFIVVSASAGADYFMRKPFGPLELIARIDSLLLRTVAH